jgi:cytochrome c
MSKKLILTSVIGLLVAASSATVLAADGAALYQSKGCIACHGANGGAPITPLYPKLNGQNDQYLLAQMKDIKSGARNNGQTAAMKGIIATVSDEEMAAIATYLSSAK